jgi:ribonuclease R
VTSFGLFVALDEVYVEGLLHVTELGSDYFHFDGMRHEMLGERSGARYRLGDRLRVTVARVDMETSKIDFTLVEEDKPASDHTSKSKSSKKGSRKK